MEREGKVGKKETKGRKDKSPLSQVASFPEWYSLSQFHGSLQHMPYLLAHTLQIGFEFYCIF